MQLRCSNNENVIQSAKITQELNIQQKYSIDEICKQNIYNKKKKRKHTKS